MSPGIRRLFAFAVFALFAAPATAGMDKPPSVVAVKKVGAGWVFTDPKGMSLYTYAQDKPGQAKCIGPCAQLWPPLAAAEVDAILMGDWSVVARPDGVRQIAYRGQPLYSYAKDAGPGTTFGDGVGEAWSVAGQDMETPPGIGISRGPEGRALTDLHGRVLYTNDDDKPQAQQAADLSGKAGVTGVTRLKSTCTKNCLVKWRPLSAPSIAQGQGDWSIVLRDDGLRQWAYQRKPLYVAADGIGQADGLWHVALVEPPPPVPSWVTYQMTDGGELVADAKGFTVYALSPEQTSGRVQDWRSPKACDAECIKAYWKPIIAPADAKPVGNWTIVKTADGLDQWAYKGEPLFTHARDTEPGEIAGARFFTRAWHTLTRSGAAMEGMDKRS